MNNKDYESTEYYSYKFKNFSTMIIIPMAILVLILIVGSFFATRQSTVTSTGIVEPQNTLNIANRNYHEGQIVRRNREKWLVHLDDKQENTVHLFPMIKAKRTVNVVTYFPGNKIGAIKKGQTLYFQVANASGTMDRLVGKVKEIGVYPINLRGNNVYEVICKAKSKKNLKYGMEGNATIITGKSTYFEYFEYFKDKILNQN